MEIITNEETESSGHSEKDKGSRTSNEKQAGTDSATMDDENIAFAIHHLTNEQRDILERGQDPNITTLIRLWSSPLPSAYNPRAHSVQRTACQA